MLTVCEEFDRTLKFADGSEIAERDWWKAYLLTAWDTGLRPSQLFVLDWRVIRPDGEIPIDFRLGRDAHFALAAIASQARPQVFSLPDGMFGRQKFSERLALIRAFAAEETPNQGGEA